MDPHPYPPENSVGSTGVNGDSVFGDFVGSGGDVVGRPVRVAVGEEESDGSAAGVPTGPLQPGASPAAMLACKANTMRY